jgi:hypothetical protein
MSAAFVVIPVSGAAPPAHPEKICQEHSLKSTVIRSTLTLKTARLDHIKIASSTTLKVPTAWPGAASLLQNDGSQWSALSCFLPIHAYGFRPQRPRITEQKPNVKFHDLVSQLVFPQAAYYPGPEEWRVGLWRIRKDGDHLNVSFQGAHLPVPVKWVIELRTDGLRIKTPAPSPSFENGKGEYRWTSMSTDAASTAAVVLPKHLSIDWALWRWPWGQLTNLLLILSYGLAFYLVIFVLTFRFSRRDIAGMELTETTKVARRIIAFGCLWFVLQGGDSYLYRLMGEKRHSQPLLTAVEAAVTALVSAWFYLDSCSSTRFGRRWPVRALVLASALVIPIFLLLDHVSVFGSTAALTLNLIPQVIAKFYFYSGVAIWAFRLWPTFTKACSPAWSRPKRKQFYIAYISATAFTVMSVGDLIITSNRDWAHYYLVGSGVHPRFDWVAASSVYGGQSSWLNGEAQAALWLLVAAAFFAVLRMAALDHPDVFFPGSGALELTSLAIMLGFLFVGTWGQIAAFPTPVALVLVIVGFRYIAVSNSGTPDLARHIKLEDARAGPEPLLTSNKEAFFDAAERIADLNSQLAAIGTGNLTADEASTKRAQIREQIEQLRQYIPVPHYRRKRLLRRSPTPRLVLPYPYDPARALLDAGPKVTWWDNGIQAMYLAVPLVLLATGYHFYKKMQDGSIRPLAFPYGLPDTFLALTNMAVDWLVVAFVFGAALPYIRGIRGTVKGVTIGIVNICALAVAAGIFHLLGGTPYKGIASDSLVFLLFLTILGVIIDARTLYQYGGSSNLFSRLYRLGSTRAVATFLVVIITTAIGIWQEANAQDQVVQQRAQIGQHVLDNLPPVFGSGP